MERSKILSIPIFFVADSCAEEIEKYDPVHAKRI
jgi:hypothetical protein